MNVSAANFAGKPECLTGEDETQFRFGAFSCTKKFAFCGPQFSFTFVFHWRQCVGETQVPVGLSFGSGVQIKGLSGSFVFTRMSPCAQNFLAHTGTNHVVARQQTTSFPKISRTETKPNKKKNPLQDLLSLPLAMAFTRTFWKKGV